MESSYSPLTQHRKVVFAMSLAFLLMPSLVAAHVDHDKEQAKQIIPSPANEHDHSQHDHGDHDTGFVEKLVSWIGKFHPASVHYPIALLIAAAVAEMLWIKTGKIIYSHAGQFCLWGGVAGAIATAILGWCFAGFRFVDDDWIMTTHRWLGTSMAAWAMLLGWMNLTVHRGDGSQSRKAYRVTLFVGAALVSVTGFFGGSLLYGLNHYAW